METLVTLGQSLGLAGVAAGLFFLLFRDVIQKNIFPMLDRERGYRLLRTILAYVFGFSISIAVIATVTQLILTGKLTTIGFNFQRGDTRLEFAINFEQFAKVTTANAKEANQQKIAQMSLNAAFQLYNTSAQRLKETFIGLRQSNAFAALLTDAQLQRIALQVQRGDLTELANFYSQLKRASPPLVEKPLTSDLAEAGYLIGQLQQASLKFDAAIAAYRSALEVQPNHYPAIRALAYALLERGLRREADTVTAEALDRNSKQPKPDKLLTSQLMTMRSDVLMWNGKFEEAEKTITLAGEAVESAAVSDGAREAAADRLNSAAGLLQNLGETARALDNIGRALELMNNNRETRGYLNMRLNQAVILIDGGALGDAKSVIEDISTKVSSLSPNDILRGYYFLLRSYAGLRSRDKVAAAINLQSAREFFDRGFSLAGTAIRTARLRCLEQRLAVQNLNVVVATNAFSECVEWTKLSGPGRIADVVEGIYLNSKIAIASGAGEASEDPLAGIELPPNLKERARLNRAVVSSAIRYREPPTTATVQGLDQTIVDLATLENKTGMLFESLNDALSLKAGKAFAETSGSTIEELNLMRNRVGARPFT